MDQEIKNEFEELARMVAEGFQSIEERMTTKEDLKNFATKDDLKILEKMMEDGFSSLRSELLTIRKDLVRLEEKIDQLAKIETKDVSAAYTDIADLRKRVEKLERQLQVQPA